MVAESTGEPTGMVLPRHEVIAGGHWCQSTNIFVLNSDGHVLCHKRSMKKDRFPGMWFTHVGGHVVHGETFWQSAHKEFCEETGTFLHDSQLLFWRKSKHSMMRMWIHEFVTVVNKKVEDFTPQEGEVDEFRWYAPEEIFEQSRRNAKIWKAGTHNFMVEYYCLRAVIALASSQGMFASKKPLHVWNLHPIAL